MGLMKGLTIGLMVILATVAAPAEYRNTVIVAGVAILVVYAYAKITSAKKEANGEEETERLLQGKLS